MVHDKINLQNSVDIAAYYGAMKQAEMLNAIAHINYQIRQSWKLLTWRYRVLGSMGLTDVPSEPASWGNPVSQTDTIDHPLPAYPNPGRGYPRLPGPYFFCVGHQHWGGFYEPHNNQPQRVGSLNDLLCKDMDSTISPLTVPNVRGGGGFTGTLNNVRNLTIQMNNLLQEQCKNYGFNSWLLAAMSFAHFNKDQSDRKQMIYQITKALMDEYGKDIDNQEIKKGVRQTFEKNLSFINNKSFERTTSVLEHFSSLKGKNPSDLIQDQPFFVTGLYAHLEGPAGGCRKRFEYVATPYPGINPNNQVIDIILKHLSNYVRPLSACGDQGGCQPSAGMFKNKKLIVYYGVKAELDYRNQIFLPFKLTLKAQAFAKPFGGRIGPLNDKDQFLESQAHDDSDFPNPPLDHSYILKLDKKHTPNYSRYPGDRWGLRSKLVHHYWTNTVRESTPSYKQLQHYVKEDIFPLDRDPMATQTHLSVLQNTRSVSRAIIARKWEIAAVAPDLFDVTYFTILPYYQYDYFPRLAKGILQNARGSYLRGDLGTYCNSPGSTCNANNFQGTSLLSQFSGYNVSSGSQQDFQKNVWSELIATLPHPLRKPGYTVKLEHLLTGWNPPIQKHKGFNEGYEKINETKFGRCDKWVHDQNFNLMGGNRNPPNRKGKIANGCIYGGRTGYSVKMIHPDMLSNLPADTLRPPWIQ